MHCRAKSWGGNSFFLLLFFRRRFDSRTSFSRNTDCVNLEPVVYDGAWFPKRKGGAARERERENGDSESAYHRIDISMFPHGHGASPPWSITTGPRLLDQGFVCRRRASSVFSPFPVSPYIHSRPSASLVVLVLPLRNILPAIFQFLISSASFQIDYYRATK